jgi:hypothetical protein
MSCSTLIDTALVEPSRSISGNTTLNTTLIQNTPFEFTGA